MSNIDQSGLPSPLAKKDESNDTGTDLNFLTRSPSSPPPEPAPYSMPLLKTRLNPRVIDAQYAVRGAIAVRAEQLRNQLRHQPGSLPFKQVVNLNIGNPQQLDQKPVTFFRQVLSLVQYPQLLEDPPKIFKRDALDRAKRLLKDVNTVGAYSVSTGVDSIRHSIAQFIEKRDGFPSDPHSIFLVNGASSAVSRMIQLVAENERSGVLVPIPQYPLYSASITLQGAYQIGYFLDEAAGWKTNAKAIEREVLNSKLKHNAEPKLLVVINPGNPTGSVLSEEEIVEVLELAARHNLTVLADEVYQTNLLGGNKFISFKKVLSKLMRENPAKFCNVSLASVHSTSKGFVGECGQRGGYVELVNFPSDTLEEFYKLASIELCPVVTGQILTELMVNPPQPGDESFDEYHSETTAILDTLEKRAHQLYTAFQGMKGVKCQPPEGAMYLFPQITIPPKAVKAAEEQGIEPDVLYCMDLLNQTGICVIAGSGFGQEPGTFHFRTTFLAPGGPELSDRFVEFHNKFMDRYS